MTLSVKAVESFLELFSDRLDKFNMSMWSALSNVASGEFSRLVNKRKTRDWQGRVVGIDIDMPDGPLHI
jgi:hypothetical protein